MGGAQAASSATSAATAGSATNQTTARAAGDVAGRTTTGTLQNSPVRSPAETQTGFPYWLGIAPVLFFAFWWVFSRGKSADAASTDGRPLGDQQQPTQSVVREPVAASESDDDPHGARRNSEATPSVVDTTSDPATANSVRRSERRVGSTTLDSAAAATKSPSAEASRTLRKKYKKKKVDPVVAAHAAAKSYSHDTYARSANVPATDASNPSATDAEIDRSLQNAASVGPGDGDALQSGAPSAVSIAHKPTPSRGNVPNRTPEVDGADDAEPVELMTATRMVNARNMQTRSEAPKKPVAPKQKTRQEQVRFSRFDRKTIEPRAFPTTLETAQPVRVERDRASGNNEDRAAESTLQVAEPTETASTTATEKRSASETGSVRSLKDFMRK